MKIPGILHGIWFGSDEIPEKFIGYRDTWKKHHPQWKFILWTDDNLFELDNHELFNKARTPAERSDIARLEILKRFGGVYADMDYSCKKNIEPLIYESEFFIVQDLPVWRSKNPKYHIPYLNNALIGCTPNHPLMNKLITSLPQFFKSNQHHHVCFRTGPGFVSQILNGERGVTVLENRKLRKDYAQHHYANTWKAVEPQTGRIWPE